MFQQIMLGISKERFLVIISIGQYKVSISFSLDIFIYMNIFKHPKAFSTSSV